MQKILLLLLIVTGLLTITTPVFAQVAPLPEQLLPHDSYYKATVEQILKEQTQQSDGSTVINQEIKIQFLQGPQQGKEVTVERSTDFRLAGSQKLTPGTVVIIDVTTQPGTPVHYTITDVYRLNFLWYLAAAFFAFTLLVAGWKGLSAGAGLAISLLVIMLGIVPAILHHFDPLTVCMIGALVILLSTTFIAHGFSKSTAVAIISTFLSLIATLIFSLVAVHLAHMAGLGTEDSFMLELNPSQNIDARGLLLGGIIIGALGALNDITTTQVAAIYALIRTNPKADLLHLIEQGFLIGREHIVSLVNTLVLAYAGSSLTVFIFFALNPAHLPWWVIVNNETVSEEIIRALAGSFGLVLAIPITTILASYLASRDRDSAQHIGLHAH
ncbi:MAG: YibE/F family protein [Patescibacteria group bacterium]|nr:YibE/F family protein [Patescibacteria group bacterium]MDE2590756.1 YibE/F family protein [Patescibacteria group bacterium]